MKIGDRRKMFITRANGQVDRTAAQHLLNPLLFGERDL
jgi:hypothetical protein